MRRPADLRPGTGKTDARNAHVIADAARTVPHLLHCLDVAEDVRAEPTMAPGHDDDLAGAATRTSNRLRGLLTQVHPALERVLGPRLRHPAVLALLQTYGCPHPLAEAGVGQLARVMRQAAPRMRSAQRPAEQITQALTSMPGVAVRTGARILAEAGDAGAFPTAAHLASWAGLTPPPTARAPPYAAKARPAAATRRPDGPCS